MKECSVCKVEKDLTEFYNFRRSKDGKGYRCKPCDNLARKKWRENNLESAQKSIRNQNLKSKYGITLKDYEELLTIQGGKCGCCGTTENKALHGLNRSHNFSVDHCHITGKIRGLLCNQCNRAIGMLGDTPEAVLKAYDYLKRTH